jgi:hypothetical protein
MIGSLLYLTATAGHPVLGMSMHSFSSVSKDFASTGGQAYIQVLASHSRLWPLVLRVFLVGTSLFSDTDFVGCQLDRKSTSGTCSFWDLLWCLGLPANSRVLLNPLPRQSMLPQLVVALSSFGSRTP